MIAIVAALDSFLNTTFSAYTRKFWGLCELSNRTNTESGQPIPVNMTGTHKRDQVSLDDKFQMVAWWRLGNFTTSNEIDGNDWDFGLDENSIQRQEITLIFAHKVELGESLIYQITQGLPGILNVSGFEIVSVDRTSIAVDHDHESIYLTELGATRYEQHRFPWNLYAVTVSIEFVPNPACV
jgi:hypothetical protein